MHTVVIRRDIYASAPWVGTELCKELCKAKEHTDEQLAALGSSKASIAWLQSLIEEEQTVIGRDWFPYGIEQNRASLEALLQYTHEQGLSDRRLKIEELFAPATLRCEPAPSEEKRYEGVVASAFGFAWTLCSRFSCRPVAERTQQGHTLLQKQPRRGPVALATADLCQLGQQNRGAALVSKFAPEHEALVIQRAR